MTTLAPGLLLVTDRGQAVHPLSRIVDAVLGAGFTGVLVREKDLDAAPLLEVAAPLAEACRRGGGAFLVSDRIDVALALEGAGAQVGAAGLPVPEARDLLGPDRLLGYSAHDAEEAARALAEGADYVTLSPVFASRSKPGYSPRGIRFLESALRRVPRERVRALGGIEDPERVRRVRDAGVGGAAIMGALMRAADPEATARALSEAWRAGEAL